MEEYNFIFAATTQQADGKAIRAAKTKEQKKDSQENSLISYDTVIIDEAARTSPRDLLIPMSQAQKRIILVGDHRQLPHIIDEEVAKALESEDGNASNALLTKQNTDENLLKMSMFEYLKKRLEKLERIDKIKRTVTLDAQYRTHPILGKFASDFFYEKFDEAYTSPLSEKYFEQNLSETKGKPCIWINVPLSEGSDGKLNTGSRYRCCEAKIIAKRLKKWLLSEEGKNFNFGLISFYKAQTFEILKELEKENIAEYTDGVLQIKEEYRTLKNGEERIRIGTVDSFQGMEFDVVLLSLVRTDSQRNRSNLSEEKLNQRTFGHLMSVNRLCVSMTRQKRILAVVGDANLVMSNLAMKAVPALHGFYELCNKEGVIL